MKVVEAKEEFIDAIMQIFDLARAYMRVNGNASQWDHGYPSRDVILADIAAKECRMIVHEGEVIGVFTYHVGKEPTYNFIEGQWPETGVYGTIHRLASSGKVKGVADCALEFCKAQGVAVRVDTHADNVTMLNWIERCGFAYCGIIYVADGSPRKAFQLL